MYQKNMLKITRAGNVCIDIRLIECLFLADHGKAKKFLMNCNQPIVNYVSSQKDIRTIIITSSNTVYTSDIKVKTLNDKLLDQGIDLLCIVGSKAYIPVNHIEAMIDFDQEQEEPYIPIFIEDKATSNTGQVIRSFVRMQSGHTYPSTFNQHTLIKKAENKSVSTVFRG